jgi:hypothetical protein
MTQPAWSDGLRQLCPPLTPAQLAPPEPGLHTIQLNGIFGERELDALANFMREYPSLGLRVYSREPITDLEFLRHFPFVRRFDADGGLGRLANFDGLRYLSPELEHLGLGRTKRQLSLRILERFTQLRELYLAEQRKDFGAVGTLLKLEKLELHSITLPDLSSLLTLSNLKWLEIKLGGTRDLRHLSKIGRLTYLKLWMIRGLNDITVIGEIPTLQELFLHSLRQVTALPSFRSLPDLKKVMIDTMNGLHDLRPIAEAPNLERLAAVAMRHLDPEAFRPFVDHPTLKLVSAGLGSDKKNAAAARVLGPIGRTPPPSRELRSLMSRPRL